MQPNRNHQGGLLLGLFFLLAAPVAFFAIRAAAFTTPWVAAPGEQQPAHAQRIFPVKTMEPELSFESVSPDGYLLVSYQPREEIRMGEVRAFFFDAWNDQVGKVIQPVPPAGHPAATARLYRLGPIPPGAVRAKVDTLTDQDLSPFPTRFELERLREKGKPPD